MENSENNMAICELCGNEYDIDDLRESPDGMICESCFDDNYGYCEECGDVVSLADFIMVHIEYNDTQYVCQECADRNYYQCDECQEYYTPGCMWATANRNICENCSDDYIICCDCEDVYRSGNAHLDNYSGEWYCESCYAERASNVIQSYGYKPYPKFGFRSAAQNEHTLGLLTFGVELEVDGGDDAEDAARDVQDVTDMVYIKHDGSLRDGFEIVSHPCTLDYHSYDMSWKHMMSICRDYGFRSHDVGTCGLHVHVGREQLGEDDAVRRAVASRVILLASKHWDELVIFSRRTSTQLHDWAKRTNLDYFDLSMSDADMEYNAYGETRGDRYMAVNVQNAATIEFRIFRGTLTRDTLIAAIQLCDNICKYAMSHTASECWASEWQDVSRYATYKELHTYLSTKGI